MPEVIFNGPAGRLEGRYQPSKEKNAPIALILHPHPQFGGTMNNKIVYDLFYMFQQRGFYHAPLQFSRYRAQSGRVRPWCGRVIGCGKRARLGAGAPSRLQDLLGGRIFVRRMDWHAASDAPPGNRRLYFGRAATEHL